LRAFTLLQNDIVHFSVKKEKKGIKSQNASGVRQ
jgi:hypothetical protein